MFRRGNVFWAQNNETGKQESLGTKTRSEAERLLNAKNEAQRQPIINLQIARAYLSASDPQIATRTWGDVMEEMLKSKRDKRAATQRRYAVAVKDKTLDVIRERPLMETRAEHFLRVLQAGKISTNIHLRRIHNFALGMNWLPVPVLPKRMWPGFHFAEKRAITRAEHETIIARETNSERRAFYELAWHIGASQSDIAFLEAKNIDWQKRVISYARMKTDEMAFVSFGPEAETILRLLPDEGPLFPYLRTVRAGDRVTEFKQRCLGLGITGITLHSYRYAWAERAKTVGYPERFAQQALGHSSKAVHRAYAKRAKVIVPALETYESQQKSAQILEFPSAAA
jgi:integrase